MSGNDYKGPMAFGTVLRDNTAVNKKALTFRTSAPTTQKTLPTNFDGRIIWKDYLTPIRNQGTCGDCWAVSASTALSDRYNILTQNKIRVNLSAFEMTICQGVLSDQIPVEAGALSQANLSAHTAGACNGNTLYNALSYIYTYGLPESSCFNQTDYKNKGLKLPTDEGVNFPDDLPNCDVVEGKDYDTCLDGKTAMRYFRNIAGYNIDQNENAIKQEIYKWGPVSAGFIVYSDFFNFNPLKDGVYTHSDTTSSPQGGHAIRIVGWGEQDHEGENTKYWIIANSWGPWGGDGGFFKMKIGLQECQMETNVVGMLPDIQYAVYPNLSTSALEDGDTKKRTEFDVDIATKYLTKALSKIKSGQLKGNLHALISSASILPKGGNYTDFWAGELSTSFVFTPTKNRKFNIIFTFIFIGILIFIIYKLYKTY